MTYKQNMARLAKAKAAKDKAVMDIVAAEQALNNWGRERFLAAFSFKGTAK
mgnify:CR=1 FL=1